MVAPLGQFKMRIAEDALRRLDQAKPRGRFANRAGLVHTALMQDKWARLERLARQEVEATLASLPAPLGERAGALPVTLERFPSPALCRDGIEPDTLGLFVGPAFADEASSAMPVPPQIMLFLENLWDEAGEEEETFRDEVRTTFLHELGHYLGLDEGELCDRGLE